MVERGLAGETACPTILIKPLICPGGNGGKCWQQVELHAEGKGLSAGGGWYPAGNAPAEIALKGEIVVDKRGQSRKRPNTTGADGSPPPGDR